ncbi:MAG: isoprenylcysteine carboxylmethyltransferase family protein [Anaerolineae bacterium]|nr:isoprenylcysteine carboxylmethyltransferase family protein [Anaerolineae bacterium]
MFSSNWWVILGYVVFIVMLLAYFDIYVRRKTGEGLIGYQEIPDRLTGFFIAGITGTWIVILYPVLYLFYPHILEITVPISLIRNLSLDVPGCLLIIVGFALTTVAMLQLGLSARIYLPGQKTHLITSGIYRFSRNPAYSGVYLSFLGIFLILPSLIYLIGFCLFLLNQHFRIQREERFLRKSFGTDYEDYCRRVRRYLGPIKG